MEKRGYVKAGQWTPEATVEHPEAGNTFCYSYLASGWSHPNPDTPMLIVLSCLLLIKLPR